MMCTYKMMYNPPCECRAALGAPSAGSLCARCQVSTWRDDPQDREMMELLTVLHGLRQTNTDVRGSCVSWMETVVLS